MKKALLVALCFIIVGLVMVNGTFALPSLDKVFQWVEKLGEKSAPEKGGEGTEVHVKLVTDDEPQSLLPGGEVSRAYSVKNIGKASVYFRLVYAIQYDEESWEQLKIDFDAAEGFIEHDGWKEITVSGTPYKMKVFTYENALDANGKSPDVTISVVMDATMTSDQIARYRSDFLKAQVLAIEKVAFEEAGYKSAEAALDAALPLNSLSPF